MGGKTVGKVLGKKTSSSGGDSGVYAPQYVKLSDGSFQLYDESKATLNYAQSQPVQGAKAKKIALDSAFGKGGATRNLESAQFDGQDLELSNGGIKFYSQTDYDNYQAEQKKKADHLKNSINASQKNLESSRKKKNSIFTGSSGKSSVPSGGSAGVFSGITE